MFGSDTKSGHPAMPSSAMPRNNCGINPPNNFPMQNSLFPEYSSSHPGFENPDAFDKDHDGVDFLASDGTPVSSMVSPNYNYPMGVKSLKGDKQIPLHVQTDETMSETDEPVQDPSEFPRLSPPYRKFVIPVFQKENIYQDGTNSKWTRYRLWILLVLVFTLLITIISLIARTTGGDGGSASSGSASSVSGIPNDAVDRPAAVNIATSAPTVALFANGGGSDAFLPPMTPTTSMPTGAPTAAPSIIVPTAAPFTEPPTRITKPPTEKPTTRAPTLNTNHPLVSKLQAVTPIEDLVNPYSPQGEALVWLATTDKQTSSNDERIIQRYAMVVLDVALHAPEPRFWSSRYLHECRWPGVTCNEERHVTGINWARQELTGTIPAELGLLTHLTSLDIAQNQLKGNLEPIYNLELLEHAYVFENYLTGTISPNLANCKNMTRFFAGHNQLTGTIPNDQFKMRPLQWFVVHFNKLTGTIPTDMNFGLSVVFDISHNQFTGTIPENLATEIMPNVRHLHLDNNQFTGSIPGTFRELGKGRLRQLYLNDNKFGGAFPADWYTVKFLNNIDISNNNFRNNLNDMCLMSVFEYGELVELRADCAICNCDRLCRTCRDNKDFNYEYDDDDWQFDDDER